MIAVVELPQSSEDEFRSALELYVEGGRVSHRWCTCVVGHGCGGLVSVGMEVVDDMHAGQSRGVTACLEMPEHFMGARWTPMTLDHSVVQVDTEDIRSHEATRRLRFVVYSSGWLHSMVLHDEYCDASNRRTFYMVRYVATSVPCVRITLFFYTLSVDMRDFFASVVA